MPAKWSEGDTVNGAVQIPPMSFDCAAWDADVPIERWSEGDTVNGAVQIPPMSFDCAAWDAPPPSPAEPKLSTESRQEMPPAPAS